MVATGMAGELVGGVVAGVDDGAVCRQRNNSPMAQATVGQGPEHVRAATHERRTDSNGGVGNLQQRVQVKHECVAASSTRRLQRHWSACGCQLYWQRASGRNSCERCRNGGLEGNFIRNWGWQFQVSTLGSSNVIEEVGKLGQCCRRFVAVCEVGGTNRGTVWRTMFPECGMPQVHEGAAKEGQCRNRRRPPLWSKRHSDVLVPEGV
mmetsp:Transcript_15548/g.49618  ORF Transcript_15548/g.49618 Transcript_15548/m.49618 type:complete len:207 (+) Transcript_15548:87-707(+)